MLPACATRHAVSGGEPLIQSPRKCPSEVSAVAPPFDQGVFLSITTAAVRRSGGRYADRRELEMPTTSPDDADVLNPSAWSTSKTTPSPRPKSSIGAGLGTSLILHSNLGLISSSRGSSTSRSNTCCALSSYVRTTPSRISTSACSIRQRRNSAGEWSPSLCRCRQDRPRGGSEMRPQGSAPVAQPHPAIRRDTKVTTRRSSRSTPRAPGDMER